MLKKMSYALPDLKESWLLLLLFVAGQLAASPVRIMPLAYCLSYIFPFLYLYFRGQRRLNMPAGEQPPVYEDICPDRPRFGRLRLWGFVPVALMTEMSVIVLLGCIPFDMEMPEWLSRAMEEMLDGNLWYNLLTMSVLAPVLEEYLFRGVILNGLKSRMAPGWAVVWSSVLFAVAHLNPWQAVPAFVLGCFFGWVYVRTRSLWAAVLMHSFNNTLTVVAAAVFGTEAVSEGDVRMLFGQWALYVLPAVSAVALAAGVILLNRYLPGKTRKETIQS